MNSFSKLRFSFNIYASSLNPNYIRLISCCVNVSRNSFPLWFWSCRVFKAWTSLIYIQTLFQWLYSENQLLWQSNRYCGGVTVTLCCVVGRADSSWISSCESPTRWRWTCTNVWATASTGRWSSITPPATENPMKTRMVSHQNLNQIIGGKKYRIFNILRFCVIGGLFNKSNV